MSLEVALTIAVTSLAAALGVLWRRTDKAHAECERDRKALWNHILETREKTCGRACAIREPVALPLPPGR